MPFSIFMAGSPGAGKTEFSRSFIESLISKNSPIKSVRIDADEIKLIIPQYNGSNSCAIQGASSLGVQKLFDFTLKHHQNVLVDETFSELEYCREDVARSFSRNRIVGIIYIYQDPLIAWKFTKIREKKEGRPIPKELFVNSFFASKENVNIVKKELPEIKVFLVIKNYENDIEKMHFNIDNIDNFLTIPYTKNQLNNIL